MVSSCLRFGVFGMPQDRIAERKVPVDDVFAQITHSGEEILSASNTRGYVDMRDSPGIDRVLLRKIDSGQPVAGNEFSGMFVVENWCEERQERVPVP